MNKTHLKERLFSKKNILDNLTSDNEAMKAHIKQNETYIKQLKEDIKTLEQTLKDE